MEYRCRLGTTSGEIIEGIYVAQSEAALRRELEDKGRQFQRKLRESWTAEARPHPPTPRRGP